MQTTQTIVSARHKLIGVPKSDQIAALFPKHVEHQFEDKPYLLVPHDETSTFLLRKLGYDAASPILTQYDFPAPVGKPAFEAQKKTTALLTMNNRAYVLNGMGTGKTKCPLWAWDYLRTRVDVAGNVKPSIGKMLVVAPLSTLRFTWLREIFETLPGTKAAVLHGSRAKRLETLADPDTDIFIINHDGIKVIAKELALRTDIDCIVIDELAVYRNKSDRTKAMAVIASKMKWVWGMTGSPIPHSPTDVYYQAQIVTPNTVPKYYSHFRAELMTKLDQFRWFPKPDAVQRAFDVMQPAVRFTIDEVQELPPCVETFLDVEMGTRQGKIYKELKNHCLSAVTGGEITAANAGAAMNKLLQVASGWVYDSDHNTHALDNDLRIQAMLDAVESSDRKVIIFAPFKHTLAGISKALDQENIEHACVSGDTAQGQRNTIFNLFQNSSKYRVLAAHPQCVAHGITLTAADLIIWFGPPLSLEIYDQANHRIKRVGQKFKQQIVHLQGSAIERKIYKMLNGMQDIQGNFLKLFEESNEEW